jgi:hypothetical protein
MRFVRRHVTYANAAATLALLLAMGGGALAATHYLITSTSQIAPTVLGQLRGTRGPQGVPGRAGKTGPRGKTGKQGPRGKPGGPRGKTGHEGPPGPPGVVGVQGVQGFEGPRGFRGERGPPGASAYSPLPAGQSESGVYSVNVGGSPTKVEYDAVSVPVVLGSPITTFEYRPAGTTSENCAGQGKAAPGFLCIYSNPPEGAKLIPPTPEVINIEAGKSASGSGVHGFVLKWATGGTFEAEATDVGTWTVTEK